ncbi:hypothetical protein [Flavobacterium sp.]|uniref:hypothetical protein n=1 Tax=Flavobacterium sp. TaxID=239 RepID=UPI0025B97A26|nr:hypothetical protein [Flavobacterium sp.]
MFIIGRFWFEGWIVKTTKGLIAPYFGFDLAQTLDSERTPQPGYKWLAFFGRNRDFVAAKERPKEATLARHKSRFVQKS